MRLYTFTYPQQVVGLALVDSVNEDEKHHFVTRQKRLDLSPVTKNCAALIYFAATGLLS
jgi:hypothetical protein